MSVAARPFLKSAGGKTQLLSELLPRVPREFKTYHEPFLGGGALFFATWARIVATGVAAGRIPKAHLSDQNASFIGAFRAVRDDVHRLVAYLVEMDAKYRKDPAGYFAEVRSWDPAFGGTSLEDRHPVELAARTILLNKTCFNGLFRVNREGRFNVPHGRYANPAILDRENLFACSRALEVASRIAVDDFESALELCEPGDFVYLDPPYVPTDKTSNFTGYTSGSFTEEDQRRLARAFHGLEKKGVLAMLSNSDTPLARELYEGSPHVSRVLAKRAINSVASKRGAVKELLVCNYDPAACA